LGHSVELCEDSAGSADTPHMIYNALLFFGCIAIAFSPVLVERLTDPESFRDMLGWKSPTRTHRRTLTELVTARPMTS
jgi:hypothetical protein